MHGGDGKLIGDRVSSSGGWGEASPSKHPASPQKEREKEEKRKRRERKRERCMVGEGERVYFCVALQVISRVDHRNPDGFYKATHNYFRT